MKSLGDFDYGFADRLRGIRYSGTGPDNKTYCDWLDEAADLLDECEQIFAEFAKAGGSGYAFRSREMLAKLRGG